MKSQICDLTSHYYTDFKTVLYDHRTKLELTTIKNTTYSNIYHAKEANVKKFTRGW